VKEGIVGARARACKAGGLGGVPREDEVAIEGLRGGGSEPQLETNAKVTLVEKRGFSKWQTDRDGGTRKTTAEWQSSGLNAAKTLNGWQRSWGFRG